MGFFTHKYRYSQLWKPTIRVLVCLPLDSKISASRAKNPAENREGRPRENQRHPQLNQEFMSLCCIVFLCAFYLWWGLCLQMDQNTKAGGERRLWADPSLVVVSSCSCSHQWHSGEDKIWSVAYKSSLKRLKFKGEAKEVLKRQIPCSNCWKWEYVRQKEGQEEEEEDEKKGGDEGVVVIC